MKLNQYFILILVFLLPISSIAQDFDADEVKKLKDKYQLIKNPVGTEFWLCFLKNYKEDKRSAKRKNNLKLELFISGDEDAKVKIEVKAIGFLKEIDVPAGVVKNVKISPDAQIVSSGIREPGMAVVVTSDNPVSVYGLNRRFQTTDTYLGLPKRVLGGAYRTVCYGYSDGHMSEFAVVATENNTVVEFNLSCDTKEHKADSVFKIRLNRGDVYQLSAKNNPKVNNDLTGSLIFANKKIAVFTGHQCAYVPNDIIACNHLVEQLPHLGAWGKHYYLGMLQSRSEYTYRAVADKDSTKVFEDSKFIEMLHAGQFLERRVKRNIQLTADKPMLVSQYSHGFNNGDSIGDPMMLLISPTQQFLSKYRFATPVNGSWNHYINLVVPTKAIGTVRLDNDTLDPSVFKPLGLSRYSIGYIRVPFGAYTLEADLPFGMSSYGFGYSADAFDAYGNMGGQSFVDYEPIQDTIAPIVEIRDENESRINLIIRDDQINDNGLKRIVVLDNQNMNADIPAFSEGVPQLSISVFPRSKANGKMTINAIDMALNEYTFTVCYAYNPTLQSMSFSMEEGTEATCSADADFFLTAFASHDHTMHTIDFRNTGSAENRIISQGGFRDINQSNFGFGLGIIKVINKDLHLGARLGYHSFNFLISSPDTVKQSVRDYETGDLLPYQESVNIDSEISNLYLSLNADYYLNSFLYLNGGLNFSLAISNNVSVYRQIEVPENWTFSDGSRKYTPENAATELSEFSSLKLGAFAGIGVNIPINYRISAFGEAIYLMHFGNLISDGDWSVNQFSLNLGIKYAY